ncbi:hypothetical protein EUX98_g2159 [Antrodiella citrinella]|uniref:DUF676 domain-containing protein n=1 Tax=Antrodiella citrinella TaxID=2447956 RepID=A0A4S4MZR8_9APHY|nr:hypothetical protein EUX98_g2159 [Antrodiella citrinella]
MTRIYRETLGSTTVDSSKAEQGRDARDTSLTNAPAAGQEAHMKSGPDGEELVVIVPETNKDSATYDGIDWCGERVTKEILAQVKRLKDEEGKIVTRFSITGYSLGGLIARYVAGCLAQKGFFQTVQPVNFSTVATPHLGQIRYQTFFSKVFAFLGPRMLSRTGEQLYTSDDWAESGRPLLDVMTDPGRIFYQTLSTFAQVRFYANTVNDRTVPYMTAAVETSDPFRDHTFNGIKIEMDEEYSSVIASFTPSDVPKPKPPPPTLFSRMWFKNVKSFKIPLPPVLQFKFPGNILVLILIPILLPAVLGLVVFRISLDNRKSRSRLRLLEKDESYRERLVHAIGRVERSIEDAAVDFMDDPGREQTSLLQADGSSPATASSSASQEPGSEAPKLQSVDVLLPLQHIIVQTLNALPNLKKHLVFVDPVTNSHAVIIARDVKRFKHHELGQGVLRHLADNFIM